MYRCAVVRYEQADAEHKRVYQDVAAGLEAGLGRKLRQEEEAWVRYRAAHCEFESSRSAGRREYQVVRLRCMAELTEARTASLRGEVEPTGQPGIVERSPAPELGTAHVLTSGPTHASIRRPASRGQPLELQDAAAEGVLSGGRF
jgi:hypothetical protein